MTALEGKALLDHGSAIARRYTARVGAEVANELRAEAVARALQRPPADGRMEPWLERIYRNLLVDRWRRGRAGTIDIATLPELASAGNPEDDLLRRERRRAVRESIAGLPPEARRALLARFYGELDDRAAATRFSVAAATIRTRVHRALARLRTRLGELRAVCPLIFGKLGAQTATLGLAPAMVVALAIGSTVPVLAPAPAPAPAASAATLSPRTYPTPAPRPVVETAPVAPMAQPRARLPRRLALPPAVVPSVSPGEARQPEADEATVQEILEPHVLDVRADPDPPVWPSMVVAPPNLLAQIGKMIEEQL